MPTKLLTLPDGRQFPQHEGKALSWSIGLHNTAADAEQGNPKTLAVIRAMKEHRPTALAYERHELVKASLTGMFKGNAKRLLNLIESA